MIEYWWFITYVLVNASIVTLLALNVSYKRITLRVANGDGDKVEMKKAIRAHGNAVEHVSIFGLVVLSLALIQASPVVQGISVLSFSLARILHAVSMLTSAFNFRRVAAGLTYITELFGLVMLLGYVIGV